MPLRLRTYMAERLTWRYIDAHADLDEWSDTNCGTFGVLERTPPRYDRNDDYGYTWTTTCLVKAPAHLTRDQVSRILNSNFRRGCSCEHDCCGHVSTSPYEVRRVKRREWRVTILHVVNC